MKNKSMKINEQHTAEIIKARVGEKKVREKGDGKKEERDNQNEK